MPALLAELTLRQIQTHLQPCPALWESRRYGEPREAAILLRLPSSISTGDTETWEGCVFLSLLSPCKPCCRVTLTLKLSRGPLLVVSCFPSVTYNSNFFFFFLHKYYRDHIIYLVWCVETRFRCKGKTFSNSRDLDSLIYCGIILFGLWDQSVAKRRLLFDWQTAGIANTQCDVSDHYF